MQNQLRGISIKSVLDQPEAEEVRQARQGQGLCMTSWQGMKAQAGTTAAFRRGIWDVGSAAR